MAVSLSFLLCPVRSQRASKEQKTESPPKQWRVQWCGTFSTLCVSDPHFVNAMGNKAYIKDDLCGLSVFNPIPFDVVFQVVDCRFQSWENHIRASL